VEAAPADPAAAEGAAPADGETAVEGEAAPTEGEA